MAEKLKLPKRPVLRYEKDYGYPIRIRKATHNLLDVVSDETRWSKVEIVELNQKKQLSNERKIDEIIKLMKEILNNGIKISD